MSKIVERAFIYVCIIDILNKQKIIGIFDLGGELLTSISEDREIWLCVLSLLSNFAKGEIATCHIIDAIENLQINRFSNAILLRHRDKVLFVQKLPRSAYTAKYINF